MVLDKKDESYLDNLLEEFGKEPPSRDSRRVRSERKKEKSKTDLMLDSLEAEFNMDDIDNFLLEDFDLDDLELPVKRVESLREEKEKEEHLHLTEDSFEAEAKEAEVVEPLASEEEVMEAPEEVPSSDSVMEEAFSEPVADVSNHEENEVLEPLEKQEVLSELPEEVYSSLPEEMEEASAAFDIAGEGDALGELSHGEIGADDLFSDVGEAENGLSGFEVQKDGLLDLDPPTEEDVKSGKKKKDKKPKKKGALSKFFGKLFANVPLTEAELQAIPTPEEEMEAKKQKAEEAKLKKEEKKAKAEADKKQKAEEAKQKAAEKKAKQKAKEEAKKEAKKNAELKRLRAEAALPPEGKINKAGATIVILFFLLLGTFVIFGSNALSYDIKLAEATDRFTKHEYNAAFQKIRGLDVKEKDMEIRNKINTVMFVNKQLNSYNNFYSMGDYANALDSLVKGLFRYDKYITYATQIGIKSDLNYVRKQIMTELDDTYEMSERDALVLMGIIDKKEYSESVYKIAAKVRKKPKVEEEEKKEFVP